MAHLDEAQAAALRGTRAADAEGRPLVLHHGTLHRFARFGRTRDIGFHFGSLEQARNRLGDLTPAERRAPGAGAPRIVSAALAARNPVVLPDDPVAWNPAHVADLFRRFLDRADREALANLRAPDAGTLAEREAGMNRVLRDALLRAGHDAVVYRNMVENGRRTRGLVDWSWLVLDPDAVVILGEDLAASAAAWPEGMRGDPGLRPDETVRALGGLRRRNCKLASVADMRRFAGGIREAAERVLGPCAFVAGNWGRENWNLDRPAGEGRLRVEITGESGRVRLRLSDCSEAARESLAGLAEAGVLVPVPPGGGGEFAFHGTWHPGESASDVATAFEAALAGAVRCLDEACGPEVAPAP